MLLKYYHVFFLQNTAAICLTKQHPFKGLIENEREKVVYMDDGSKNNLYYMTTSINCKHSSLKYN